MATDSGRARENLGRLREMTPEREKRPLRVLFPMSFSRPKRIAFLLLAFLLGSLLLPSSLKRPPQPPIGKLLPRLDRRYSLLVVGDSLSIALGEQLERHFARYSNCIDFERLGKVSSGLARPEFFDWDRNLQDLASRRKPDIVVIMIGTNDNKPLMKNNHTIPFATASWRREYAARTERLYEICRRQNPEAHIFWVGAPVMGNPEFGREVQLINQTISSWCRDIPSCNFVDTWRVLADANGNFAQTFRDERTGEPAMIRAKDGVHVTAYGGYLLAKVVIDSIMEYYSFD